MYWRESKICKQTVTDCEQTLTPKSSLKLFICLNDGREDRVGRWQKSTRVRESGSKGWSPLASRLAAKFRCWVSHNCASKILLGVLACFQVIVTALLQWLSILRTLLVLGAQYTSRWMASDRKIGLPMFHKLFSWLLLASHRVWPSAVCWTPSPRSEPDFDTQSFWNTLLLTFSLLNCCLDMQLLVDTW